MTFKIIGLDELQAKLERVPREVSKKVLRRALKKAATLVKEAFGSAAPKDTGFLSEHFNIKYKNYQTDIAASAFIGPDSKADYPRELPKGMQGPQEKGARSHGITVESVARFLELGTTRMAPKPFMTQSFAGQRDAALAIIVSEIQTALEEEAK